MNKKRNSKAAVLLESLQFQIFIGYTKSSESML